MIVGIIIAIIGIIVAIVIARIGIIVAIVGIVGIVSKIVAIIIARICIIVAIVGIGIIVTIVSIVGIAGIVGSDNLVQKVRERSCIEEAHEIIGGSERKGVWIINYSLKGVEPRNLKGDLIDVKARVVVVLFNCFTKLASSFSRELQDDISGRNDAKRDRLIAVHHNRIMNFEKLITLLR